MIEEKSSAAEEMPGEKNLQEGHPEIKEMEERIKKLESRLEKEKSSENKERAVKQEIKTCLEEWQQTPSFASSLDVRDESKEIAEFEFSQQVGTIVSLVFEKGLSEAISVAREINNPAVLDELHDALVDRYYKMLKEKGILEP